MRQTGRLRGTVVAPLDDVADLSAGITTAPTGRVVVGRVGYIAVQIGVYSLQITCVAYFIVAGLLYRALPSTQLATMLDNYALTLEVRYYPWIGAIHLLFALLHSYAIVSAVIKTTTHRWLGEPLAPFIRRSADRLLSSQSIQNALGKVHDLQPHVSLSVAGHRAGRVKTIIRIVSAIILTPHVLFDVESDYFDVAFLAREVVDTFFQTYQAYKMSRLLPRPNFNRCYFAVLVINCWSTPLLHSLHGQSSSLARLLCLVCDVLLNTISLIVVPVWLTLDYVGSYDPSITNFPDFRWYNDTWLVRFMHDAPLILLGSWIEALSRLAFSLSMLLTMRDIKKLIRHKAATAATVSVESTPPATAHEVDAVTLKRARAVRWTHRGMVFFGLLILSVQIYAESKPTVSSCVVPIRPWFSSRSACALVEIDCIQRSELSADRNDFESIFAQLEPSALTHIVIRHCSHLEITSSFLCFRNLIGFKTYNTTLATWGADAAISQEYHPQLRFLFFVRTDLPNAALPQGLLAAQTPQLLSDIEICVSNLNSLPDDLHQYWSQPLVLLIEFAQLTEFPMVLTKMHPFILSLSNNHITSLPRDALLLPDPYLVAFTGNPITMIPDLGNESAVVTTIQVFVDGTVVAGPLPDWIDDAFVQHTTLYLGGSPFCDQVVLNTSSPDRPGLLASRPWLLDGRVDCTVFSDVSFYPLRVDDYPDHPDAAGVRRPV